MQEEIEVAGAGGFGVGRDDDLLKSEDRFHAAFGVTAKLPEMPGVVVEHVLFQRAAEFVELDENFLMERAILEGLADFVRVGLVGVEGDLEVETIEDRPDFGREMLADILGVAAPAQKGREDGGAILAIEEEVEGKIERARDLAGMAQKEVGGMAADFCHCGPEQLALASGGAVIGGTGLHLENAQRAGGDFSALGVAAHPEESFGDAAGEAKPLRLLLHAGVEIETWRGRVGA